MKFLVLILLFSASFAKDSACDQDQTDCAFYCLKAAELSCDSDNYLNKAYRYCHAFTNKLSSFTRYGKIVMEEVRTCLIERMKNEKRLTCENVKQRAISSHFSCYKENGFCDLNPNEKALILWLVRSETSDPIFFHSMIRTQQFCIEKDPDYQLIWRW